MKTLSEKEIIKIIEKNLPKIIERHPEVRMKIEEILEKKAATKDDIKAILLELKKQREELIKQGEELKKQREETTRRFEEMRREYNKRFEMIDKKFEQLIKEMREGFERMDRKIERTVSMIGSRWGVYAEESLRKGFEDVLTRFGFSVLKWRKYDKKAKFFLYPREAEIDILIKDSRVIAIEVKSSLTKGEVEDFERVVRFYEESEKKKVDEKILIAIYSRKGANEYAQKLGIKVLKGYESAEEYFADFKE